jgi:Fe-S-cluster containining protein
MVSVAAETVRENPCLGCPSYCCSGNLINVCSCDVWLIARELRIKPTDFLAFADLSEESPYDFKLDSSDRTYCLALYMKELPDGSRRCIFALDLPNHQVRCGIYPFRPIGCQAYPFAFAGEEIAVKPWAFCPEATWDLSQLDLAYWQEELGRHDMEFSIHAFVVAGWNKEMMKQPRMERLSFRPFLHFLIGVCSRLEPVRGMIPAPAWSAIRKQWRQFTARGVNPLLSETHEGIGVPGWGEWLRGIQSVVAEASQDIQLPATGREGSLEEVLP